MYNQYQIVFNDKETRLKKWREILSIDNGQYTVLYT